MNIFIITIIYINFFIFMDNCITALLLGRNKIRIIVTNVYNHSLESLKIKGKTERENVSKNKYANQCNCFILLNYFRIT